MNLASPPNQAPVKRSYRSPVRQARAAATRAAIRAAATALFVANGYPGTNLREVARRAGVAERTLYLAFPTKAALFGHCLDVAVGGDEAPVAVADREPVQSMLTDTDPHRVLASSVRLGADLLDRAGALIMVSIEAAGADADMRVASQAGAAATYATYSAIAEHLAALGALSPATDVNKAADVMYALASPFTHRLLRHDRGWSTQTYREWLLASLVAQVLRRDG